MSPAELALFGFVFQNDLRLQAQEAGNWVCFA